MKKASFDVNKWELCQNVFENLTERRAQSSTDLYKPFYLRYLSPHMRELVWKGILYNGITAREYENNVKTEKIYTVSKDDIFVLKMVQEVLREDFH